MQALINVKYQGQAYQVMSLGLEPGDFPDAFRRCALAFIGTAEGIRAMRVSGRKSLDFRDAFQAMPAQLCVMYGFFPVRDGVPEIDMGCYGDGPVASLSQCIPDKGLTDTACALLADGPREPYDAVMAALRAQGTYDCSRDQRAWQLMRAIDAYNGSVLPYSACQAMAEALYDNAGTATNDKDTEG